MRRFEQDTVSLGTILSEYSQPGCLCEILYMDQQDWEAGQPAGVAISTKCPIHGDMAVAAAGGPVPCPACSGTGECSDPHVYGIISARAGRGEPPANNQACLVCNGSGRIDPALTGAQ